MLLSPPTIFGRAPKRGPIKMFDQMWKNIHLLSYCVYAIHDRKNPSKNIH